MIPPTLLGSGWKSLLVQHSLETVDQISSLVNDSAIVCVSGPIQTLKSSLLAAIMLRCISISATKRTSVYGDERRRFHFANAPREMRNLRKLSPGDEANADVYLSWLLALDDLDKVEPQYRALVRDVIVHRGEHNQTTLVSMADLAVLRSFDVQVYERIMRGKIIRLHPALAPNTLTVPAFGEQTGVNLLLQFKA